MPAAQQYPWWLTASLAGVVLAGGWLFTRPGRSLHPNPSAARPVCQRIAEPSPQAEEPLAAHRLRQPPNAWELAASELLAETDAGLDPERLDKLAGQLAVADIPGELEWLIARDGAEAGQELKRRLLARWATADSRAAARWVERLPAGAEREAGIEQVAVAWANGDPAAALAWVRELPAEQERQQGWRDVVFEAARVNPRSTISLVLSENPPPQAIGDFLAYASAQWTALEPEAAASWAGQLGQGPLRETVLGAVATAWADTDPVQAGRLAVTTMQPGRTRDDAIVSIVQRWAQKDPSEAAKWVQDGLPPGAMRRTAVENLVSLWSDQNLVQAGSWLQGLAPEEFRDAAAGAYALKAALVAPTEAVAWAESIQNPALRASHLAGIESLTGQRVLP